MATTEKAIALTAELRDSLRRYFASVSDVQFDVDGNPFLTATQGTLAAGQQAALVKILPVPSIQVDGLGLAQRVYATHIVQVLLESSTTAHIALMLESNKLYVLEEAGARNCEMQLYLGANGAAVATSALIAGNLEQTWWGPSLKYRLMQNS